MTCRCIKTEENEKEPSDFGDYDPYRADWTAPNSLHGSRYSLENAATGRRVPPGNAHHSGYTSTDETVHSDATSGRGGDHGRGGGADNDSYVPDRQYIHNDPNQRIQQVSS